MMRNGSWAPRSEMKGLAIFGLNMAGVVLLLSLADGLAGVVQDVGLRRFASFEDAAARLPEDSVLVPDYFPQTFRWPPSLVLAQKRPYTALVMAFDDGRGETVLVISQAASTRFDATEGLALTAVKVAGPFRLKGRAALLETGACGSLAPCSRLSWNEHGLAIDIRAAAAPIELIRLAGSMIE